MDDYKTIKLTALQKAIDESWENGKTAFIFDPTELAPRFFVYSGKLVELNRTMVKMSMGAATLEDLREEIRRQFYFAMKNGETLAFYSDKLIGRFNEYFDEKSIPEEIFDPKQITDENIYKKILKEDEDVDNFGNKGYFSMKDEFKVCMIVNRTPDDSDNHEIGERLDTDKFDFYLIEN